MCTSKAAALRRKYGRYLPWQRLNVDQVPLPFINDMDYTYEQKGAKRVQINQGGASLSKRMATGQIVFRPAIPPPDGLAGEALAAYKTHLLEQPFACILFRGQGNITQAERDAYPDDLVVLWQDKAWVGRPEAVKWVEQVIKPFIEAERKAGAAVDSTRYLLFQDNLDSQKQPAYIDALAELGVDDHKVPPDHTDEAQPIDRGLGRQVKIYIGQQFDEWLQDDDNLERWESTTRGTALSASDRRILLAHWFNKAVKKALQGDAKWKYFEHAGALLTADGSEDDKIQLEGAPSGYKVVVPPPDGMPDNPLVSPNATEPEPEDVNPLLEEEERDGDHAPLDDDDDQPDPDLNAPGKVAPAGYSFAAAPPTEEQLAFSKEASAADELVGRSILFNWGAVGWHVGKITKRNQDGRIKRGGSVTNFYIFYEIDDDEPPTALGLDNYDGDAVCAWVLLDEAVAAE